MLKMPIFLGLHLISKYPLLVVFFYSGIITALLFNDCDGTTDCLSTPV